MLSYVAVGAAIMATVMATTCPSGFPTALGPNLCVFVSTAKLKFCPAIEACKAKGGHLLRGEQNLQKAVQHGAEVMTVGEKYWIGLTDMAERAGSFAANASESRKKWRWLDQTRRTATTNWHDCSNAVTANVSDVFVSSYYPINFTTGNQEKDAYILQPRDVLDGDNYTEFVTNCVAAISGRLDWMDFKLQQKMFIKSVALVPRLDLMVRASDVDIQLLSDAVWTTCGNTGVVPQEGKTVKCEGLAEAVKILRVPTEEKPCLEVTEVTIEGCNSLAQIEPTSEDDSMVCLHHPDSDSTDVVLADAPESAELAYICQPSALLEKRTFDAAPTSEDTSRFDQVPQACPVTPSPQQPFKVENYRKCALSCFWNEACQTYYYNEVEKKCLLVTGWNVRLNDSVYDNDPNWMRYK